MMNAIAGLSTLPLTHALGWTLLHFCWQGMLASMLLACTLGLMPRQAARMRYAAACTAMALMLAMPLITFARLIREAEPAGSRMVLASGHAPTVVDGRIAGSESADLWLYRCEQDLNRSLPGVILFWIGGVVLLACRLNIGLMAAHRTKTRGTVPPSSELQPILWKIAAQMGIGRAVRLAESARVDAPSLIGWLRPMILLPAGCLTGLSVEQIEAILAHELAHIRRNDYLISLLQSLFETVFFYHPAVWWVSSQIRQEREVCCDDLAAAISGNRVAYAKALVWLEEHRGAAAAGALGATGGVLKMRIARLLGVEGAPAFSRTVTAGLLAAAVAITVPAMLATARAQEQPATPAQGGTRSAGADQHGDLFTRWLNEDVRWIITPEEKAAFLRLTNDEERMAFVRQFWERRNPTPGSPENAFRQEHYRRIAYANMHFAENGRPGWATDRGHVYIVFGPPDSIDAHPDSTGAGNHPWEVWSYRSIRVEESVPSTNGAVHSARSVVRNDVEFRFVDECGCGQPRLESPLPQ